MMSDKPLEDRLEEESKYSLEDQEYDGALSYHLPSKKDLTNYYPPSTGNVQGMEKAILHTVGEVPSNWVMSLTPEEQKELSDLSPEMIEHLPRVYDYYETGTSVTKDLEDTAKRQIQWKELASKFGAGLAAGTSGMAGTSPVTEAFDVEKEYQNSLDEVRQQKLGEALSLFETQDKSDELVVNDKIPNNVQEGMMGKLWNKIKDATSNAYKSGIFLGNATFFPGKTKDTEVPEELTMSNPLTIAVMTGKFLSYAATAALGQDDTNKRNSGYEENLISDVQRQRDQSIRNFQAVTQDQTWESLSQNDPIFAQQILDMPFVQGDEAKAKAIVTVMIEANNPQLMDANNEFVEAIHQATAEQIKKIASGEDTVGELVVNALGAYSKYFVGSISTGAFLLATEEGRRMKNEFGLKESIKKMDYKPSEALGINGTFSGSMMDIGSSFAFDPTIWLFTPATGVRAGAVKQFAHAKYIKGFMNKGLGKAFADDLYKILKEGTYLQKKELLKNFSDANQGRLKNIVKDDIARGTSEVTSERFYKVYTDTLLQGDNPYIFHKTYWNRFKAQRNVKIIGKALNGDGKALKAFDKLLTTKNISTKVNLAGPNARRSVMEAIENMIHGTKLPEGEINNLLQTLDDSLEELFEATLNSGTNFNGSALAALRLQIINQSDLINFFEMGALGKNSRNVVKHLGDDTTVSGQSIRNLDLDEIADVRQGADMPTFEHGTVKKLLTKAKNKLQTLKAEGAAEDIILGQQAYISKLQKNQSAGIVRPRKGQKQGEIVDYDTFDIEQLFNDESFMGNPQGRAQMQRLLDDANELAGLVPGSKESVNASKNFTKFLDDFNSKLNEIAEQAGKGVNYKKIDLLIKKEHRKLLNKLDKQMRAYDELLNTSIRSQQQKVMQKALDTLVYKLGWHKFENLQGGWFTLSKVGDNLYDQASKIKFKGQKLENNAEGKRIAQAEAKGKDVFYIENPIKIIKNKAGEVIDININWVTLKVMMQYKDEVGAASAVLRGQAKYTDRAQGTKFILNEAEDAFLASGRKYDSRLISELKKNEKFKSTSTETTEELIEQFIGDVRNTRRATNQVVEGELPISPLEFFVMNQAIEGGNVTALMRKINGNKIYQAIENFNRAWILDKVAKPGTAFVAAFDEVFFYKSIYGWKGTRRDYLFNRGVRQNLREIRKLGGIEAAMENPKLAKEINKWVNDALETQQQLPIEVAQRYKMGFDNNAPVELLKNTDAGFFQYATQHIDSLLNDYGFQQYAQVLEKVKQLKVGKNLTQAQLDDLIKKGTDQDWVNWFGTSDADYIKGLKMFGYKQGEGMATHLGLNLPPVPYQHYLVNAEEGWKYYESMKAWYTLGVPANKVDSVWNAFLKAARERGTGTNLKALPDKNVIGYIRVPGVRKQNGFLADKGLAKLTGRETGVMEQMFGNPAWNRANLIANKAHATRKEQLRALFESQGKKIINSREIGQDLSVHAQAIDPRYQSDIWGMSYFDENLFKAGYVTDDYIEALAADYATNEIDDMMLKFHLSTPLGKEFRSIAPFGGPWADFWGRYLKDLGRRSQLRGNWWAYTDEKTASNFVKSKINDTLNFVPNLRRYSYMSRIANAELQGTVSNPLHNFGFGEENINVDFSPLTFLPNGNNAMFVINPIGGILPVMLIGAMMNTLDDDKGMELQDTVEDLFPSQSFFPPEEQWKYNTGTTLRRFLMGGGVIDSSLRATKFVAEALGMGETPQSIEDVPTSLKYARTENNYLYDNTNVILNMETNWDTIGDFTNYVNTTAKATRNNAGLSISGQTVIRMGVPVNVAFSSRYVDVADNWISFGKDAGVFEDIVRPASLTEYRANPYNEDNKIQVLNDIRSWWFDLGNTTEGRAKQLLLQRQHPEVISLTIPSYIVTELGERLLVDREGKLYQSGDVFRTGSQDNSSQYKDYLAEGLISVRLPDEKVKHIIHENAGFNVNAVSVIYDRLAEIANEQQLDIVKRLADVQGFSESELLVDADLRETYGIEFASDDVKNLEDISEKLLRSYTLEQLGPDVVGLIQEVTQNSDLEIINGRYNVYQLIPHLYAAQKAGKLNPAYVFSSQDPADQQFNKGMALLSGLTKSKMFFNEDADGPAQLRFLETFERKMFALKEEWESNDGQIANNEDLQNIVDDVFETFTIFNHIMGDIYSFDGSNVLSGEQWWNFYVKPNFKALSLDWKQPVPAEGTVSNATFNVTLSDQDQIAEFQTITSKRPFRAIKINANGSNVPDGDTINTMYSNMDVDAVRVIGIMAYEMGLDPTEYPEESEIAITQKAFLQQLVDTYEGRLYYVTDTRFGNDNRKDPYGRALGWLYVENGLDGDLADGTGEYVFFSDHFSPADNYYNINSDEPSISGDYSTDKDNIKWDLRKFTDMIEVENE
ncbi:MAG: hypothetical protein CBD98_004450 [Flavobacteriaceae bacterium TMED238]|nr:hypothetical protein [Flavobacteriaceae bacterium]RPG60941.1 MAG: hypothetical protein CBD98_004450 [Flavobacteriaceae bacterium TMED238]